MRWEMLRLTREGDDAFQQSSWQPQRLRWASETQYGFVSPLLCHRFFLKVPAMPSMHCNPIEDQESLLGMILVIVLEVHEQTEHFRLLMYICFSAKSIRNSWIVIQKFGSV